MRASVLSFYLFLSSIASLQGCSQHVYFSEQRLAAKDVPQAIKDFVDRIPDPHHSDYSIIRDQSETFIEATVANATQPTEYLFDPSGELIESSVPTSLHDLDVADRIACESAIQNTFVHASILSIEKVTRYNAGNDTKSLEITVKVPNQGTGYYELELSNDGAVKDVREIPLSAIDTLF
jgi:hypothetical protein